jgi:uncharacterized membrane protein
MNARRILLALLAAGLALNGLRMLFAPLDWYHALASVPHTGPFNAHFVQDVGCAYLAAALGLALGAWRPAWIVPGGLVALAFLGLHGGVHLWDAVRHAASAAHSGVADLLGVFGPVLLVVLALVPWPSRTERPEARP